MRSISIIYKKPEKQLRHQQFLDSLRIRRSVDEYYIKLQERGEKKNNQYEHRTTTSKGIRLREKNKLVASLKVIKLSNKETSPIHAKITATNLILRKNFSVRKTQTNIFSFKIPNHDNFLGDQIKQESNDKGCKLKTLLQLPISKKKETIVVLSVDFILNQLNFWDEEVIDENALRVWKTVQNIASIVWLVRRENSLKKLTSYIRENNLNADGVYMVVPKKKGKTLSVSYAILERQLKLERNRKLIVINGLRVENLNSLNYSLFESLVPQIRHSDTFIHFSQIDVYDKNRFGNVLKILSKSLPEPISLNSIYTQFHERQISQVLKKTKQISSHITNEFMLERVQFLKKDYCSYFNRVVGLKRMEGEQSIPFIVGDMLKRNFQNLTMAYKADSKIRKQENPEQTGRNKGKEKSHPKIYFNRPVYLWNF